MTIDDNLTPAEIPGDTPKEPETANLAPDTQEVAPATPDETPEVAPEAPATEPEPVVAEEAPADAPAEEAAAEPAVAEVPAEAPVEAPVEEPAAPATEPEPVVAEEAPADAPAEEAAAEPAVAEVSAEAPVEAPVEEPAAPAAEVPAEPEPTPEPVVAAVAVPAPKPPKPGGKSDMDLFEQAMANMESGEDQDSGEGLYKKLSRGDRIEATVIQVDRDRVFVDLGTKSEGIVPLGELSELNLETAVDHVKVGDKINVVVLRPEGGEGNPIVSKKRADFEEAWDQIEQTFKDGEFISAQVVDRVKGGLVVDVGVRGFVPATHVGSGRLRNIEKYVGQPLKLKIIEIDRERKKVVLSNREAEEERRVAAREDLFENANPGDTREGVVRRLTDYGAFVDLGGVDGLLHISEMSWMRINHPREMFKEGQKIPVMILRLDKAAGKISLGHRQVLPDPWNLIKQAYIVGQKLTCTIGRIVQSGAFIRLPEGAEAFMPVSEMSSRRIRKPQDVLEENQEVEAQVIDLRTEERRMVLSIRALGGVDYGRPEEMGGGMGGPESEGDGFRDKRGGGGKRGAGAGAGGKRGGGGGGGGGGRGGGGRGGGGGGRGREDEDVAEVIGRRGYATGGATIGERLGMLKGFIGRDELDEEPTEVPETPAAEEAAEGGGDA